MLKDNDASLSSHGSDEERWRSDECRRIWKHMSRRLCHVPPQGKEDWRGESFLIQGILLVSGSKIIH